MLIFLMMAKLWALDLEFYKFTNNPVYSISEDALAHHSLVKNYYPWLMTASLNYVKTPLSIKENDLRTGDLVKDMTSFHFGGTYSFKENFYLSLIISFTSLIFESLLITFYSNLCKLSFLTFISFSMTS